RSTPGAPTAGAPSATGPTAERSPARRTRSRRPRRRATRPGLAFGDSLRPRATPTSLREIPNLKFQLPTNDPGNRTVASAAGTRRPHGVAAGATGAALRRRQWPEIAHRVAVGGRVARRGHIYAILFLAFRPVFRRSL